MSITKITRKSGGHAYKVRWREDGRNRARVFDRKGDAELWEVEVRRRKQLGPIALAQLTTSGPTLGEWIARRWAPEHGATLAKRTRNRYASSYELHVEPELGDVPINELTVARLREWQAARLEAGCTPETIEKCRTFLSSVLRHAAEAEAIIGNPLPLVRRPAPSHSDEVVPLAPATVEAVRAILAAPMPTLVPAGMRAGRPRRAYEMPDGRDHATRLRDAALVSVLAYIGPRPGEVAALRWQDVGARTLLVQRATEEDGTIKSTKGRQSRSVRLLEAPAADLRVWRMAAGNPPASALVFPRYDGEAWTMEDWSNWRARTWRSACERAGLDPAPRLYDLRHSFASLLLAEGRTIHYVAKQLGHSPEMTLRTYGHVVAEFEDAPRIDVEQEIAKARSGESGTHLVPAEAL